MALGELAKEVDIPCYPSQVLSLMPHTLRAQVTLMVETTPITSS